MKVIINGIQANLTPTDIKLNPTFSLLHGRQFSVQSQGLGEFKRISLNRLILTVKNAAAQPEQDINEVRDFLRVFRTLENKGYAIPYNQISKENILTRIITKIKHFFSKTYREQLLKELNQIIVKRSPKIIAQGKNDIPHPLHSKSDADEGEKTKQKIHTLLTSSHVDPQPKIVNKVVVEATMSQIGVDQAIDIIEKQADSVEEIVLSHRLNSSQEQKFVELIDNSTNLRKVTVNTRVTESNSKVIQAIESKGIEIIITAAESKQELPSFVKDRKVTFEWNSKDLAKNDQALEYFEQHLEEVEEIELGNTLNPKQAQRLAQLIQESDKLKSIKATLINALDEKSLNEAITTKNGLETVQCQGSNQSLADIATHNPEVKELALILNCEPITLQGTENLLKLSELVHLFLHFPEALFDKEGLKKFFSSAEKLSHLTTLSLQGDNPIDLLAEHSDQFKQLKRLNLTHCKDFLDPLERLSKANSNISIITITNSSYFKEEVGKTSGRKQHLWQILRDFNLKKLTLKGFHFDFQDYIALGKLKNLEKLQLSYPSDGGAFETIKKLINDLPNLKKIVFFANAGKRHGFDCKDEIVIGRTSLPPHEQQKLQEIFQARNIEIVRDDSLKFGRN